MTNENTATSPTSATDAAPQDTARAVESAPGADAVSPVAPPSKPAAPSGPDIDPERLDADAVRVVLRLKQSGHEAYLVGGCVRDLLIGREPKDFDIATSATPDQVRGLFRNCRLIGRRFRLAHVYFKGGKILEVSTFRASPMLVEEPQPSEAVEGEVHSAGTDAIAAADQEALVAVEHGAPVPETPVEDVQDEVASGEHPLPDEVAPVEAAPVVVKDAAPAEPRKERDFLIKEDNVFGTAEEDARRRDFTMNGLFYDPVAGKVIDHVKGLRDLALREIRTIGDPEQRMREDPVRILRAVRFAGKLGLDIESWTYAAMEGSVEDLPRCAPPRLLEETFRLIRGGGAAPALRLLAALDGLQHLLAPIDEYLKEQEKEGVEEYFRFVDVMDRLVREGAPFDDSMLLASILLPLALEESEVPDTEENSGPPAVARAIEALLQELVQKARLPRRIAERAKSILLSQRTLAGLRKRRGGQGSFRNHPLFRESLRVFEVWVSATGEFKEALEKWQAGGAPTPVPGADGPKGRRRRRRGRNRGGERQDGPQ